jgi:hypothetical protein
MVSDSGDGLVPHSYLARFDPALVARRLHAGTAPLIARQGQAMVT